MFKKLREKVEGVESPEKDGSFSPVTRRSSMPVTGKGRQRADGLHKTDSTSFFSSISETNVHTGQMSTEELLSALMQRTTQIKKMEMKLADYSQALKECSKEKEKLSFVLEKQQDSAMKRISELEESSSQGKKKTKKIILKLEEKGANLIKEVETLKEENLKLQELVDKWENESDDFEKKKLSFFAKRDNKEELSDLQMQEMAKLKHMLMLSEKQCETHQRELDQKVGELIQYKGAREELESSLRAVTDSLNTNRRELEVQVTDNNSLALSNSILTNENNQLKEKVTSLSCDLKQTRSAHSDSLERYESLKHSSEVVINKATLELDEKQGTIEHLQEKVVALEKRAAAETLSENEQVQALVAERTALENKLEESRLQLSSIKSTWSVKIIHLEQQVSHLNAKIAEDREELTVKDEKILQLETISKEMLCLQAKVAEAKHEHQKLLEKNENYLQQITELQLGVTEQSTKHSLDRSKLISSREELAAIAQEKENGLRNEISRLETLQCEVLERINLVNNEIAIMKSDNEKKTNLLDDVQQSRNALQKECENLKKFKKELEQTLKSTEERLSNSDKELTDVRQQLTNTQVELTGYYDKLEEAKYRLESGNFQSEAIREQLEEKVKELSVYKETTAQNDFVVENLEEKISVMEMSLQAREDELMKCKEETAALRNKNTEDNDEFSNLKEEKKRLEDLLAERERTVKVKQQRLNDLKKALNKELSKKSTSTLALCRSDNRTPSPRRGLTVNGLGSSGRLNTMAEDSGPEDAVPNADLVNNDLDLTTVNTKYLKHVMLSFLGGSRSEAQQLVKALSMLLNFNKEEEKFVKQILEYRDSWFGSKPSAKTCLPKTRKGDK